VPETAPALLLLAVEFSQQNASLRYLTLFLSASLIYIAV
jgi:hypothetical protein